MQHRLQLARELALALGLAGFSGLAQTDGTATFRGTLVDYNGTGTRHWTAVWITTGSGTFIKTVWRQGQGEGGTDWVNHLGAWWSATGGNTAVDGYSSATATSYSGTNSPVIWAWNCRNSSNALVADGAYKFWMQYAENSGQGPYTTNGVLWTKGPAAATNTYSNFGTNIIDVSVVWAPLVSPPPPPRFTFAGVQGNNFVIAGTGAVSRVYYVLNGTNLSTPRAQWATIATNTIDASGNFRFTNALSGGATPRFYMLRMQ